MDQNKPDEADSLDSPSTVVEDTGVISAESVNPIPTGPPPKPPLFRRIIDGLFGFNIYLLLFIFVVIVAGIIALVSYNYSKKKDSVTTVNTTTLSQEVLDQLANSDANVGTSGQVLNVQSSAVFAGKVLARSDLEVAGSLQIGGSLNLPNINVTDTATLGQVNISKNLSVNGNSAVQGQQTIGQSLQVGGAGNFNGAVSSPQISTNSLNLNGDLVLTHHIIAGGGTPGRSNGTALGSGGTATVGGSDTAGSISINTGSGTNAGCFINVTFAVKFNSTPRILITPVGSAAGEVKYYVNRTTTGFSVCTTNAAPTNASFSFDYFVVG
jgi:cytoskeletal protein CcmA (bactofilin family)